MGVISSVCPFPQDATPVEKLDTRDLRRALFMSAKSVNVTRALETFEVRPRCHGIVDSR
jgi:hypothetical protein